MVYMGIERLQIKQINSDTILIISVLLFRKVTILFILVMYSHLKGCLNHVNKTNEKGNFHFSNYIRKKHNLKIHRIKSS